MVSKDRIREEELTTEDVLDIETERPKDEVEILDVWERHPEEAPGDNVRIDAGWLKWERDGFDVQLESYKTTHWRATVTVPEEIGGWFPREIDLKSSKQPESGYIETVETEDYKVAQATLILGEMFMPTREINNWIDELLEYAEGSEEFQEELEEKMAVAQENEEQQKQARTPGWSDEHDAFVCPHCKETSNHVSERDEGGFDCVHCGESVDEYVESENGD